MARFAYDVNTRTRLIDVHKQFNGGLKTVDTDDALGSVYLRQAENVSLSEFGFIEKRYGTVEKDLIKETNGTLQGYWEYKGFSIFVIDGVFYYKGIGNAVAVNKLYREDLDDYAPTSIQGQGWRYPNGVFGSVQTETIVISCSFVAGTPTGSSSDISTTQPACTNGATYTTCVANTDGSLGFTCTPYTGVTETKTSTYQALDSTSFPQVDSVYRDMNAVNINNVLYVFTGKYPIYIKIVNSIPRLYMFPISEPTYDEIVVTGHNLLEDDYDDLYFKTKADIQYTQPGTVFNYTNLTNDFDERPPFVVQKDSDNVEIKQHAPLIPFQDGGTLDFNFKYVFNPDYLEAYNSSSQDRIFLLSVQDIGYRTSGAGASEFISSDKDAIEFTKLHNYTGNTDLQVGFDSPLIGRQELEKDISSQATTIPSSGFSSSSTNEVFMHNSLVTVGGSGSGGTTAYFAMDVNTEKNGVDFVSKDSFVAGEEFEFRLIAQTNDANNPIEPLHIPSNDAEMDAYFSGLPTTKTTTINGVDITEDVNWNIQQQVLPKIRILPIGENNVKFDAQVKVIKLNEGLTKSTNGYRFIIPSTLVANESVIGYEISLRGEIYATHAVISSNFSTNANNPATEPLPTLDIFKEMLQIETLTFSANTNLATTKNIGVRLKNLLSGTYDFRLRYRLQKFTLDSSNFLNITNDDDGEQFADVFFYNIAITAEKLQDIPGQTEDFTPKLKPIWSCNKVMEHYGKLMVWGSTEMPTALFYSFPDRPTYFPSKFYLDFTNDTSQPLEAVTPYMNILVAQTASQTFGIRGNSGLIDAPAPYAPFGINSTVGTISYKSVRPVRNHLFFLSKQGVIALKSLYAADEQYNIDFVDRNIRNIVPQDSKAVGVQFDNQYWLNFPENSITLRWYIDKKAWVQDVYQGWSDFDGVFKYQIVNGKLEFITHPSTKDETNANKTIYRMGIDYDIPTDLFAPIKAKFETSFLNQNYPFHQKNYKEAKLDFTIQNEYNKGREDFYDSSQDTAFGDNGSDEITITVPQAFQKNHTYRIAFTMEPDDNITHIPLSSISIEGETSYVTGLTPVGDANNTLTWDFSITDDYQEDATTVDFLGEFSSNIVQSVTSIIITDVTYDDELTFSTYVISEDKTLNFDNYSGYNQATADVDLDLKLKGQLGDWQFGESDFGKKVTAVKTIKLSGKGYNAKLYLEDTSKSKWTLESMGLTYKMKRARSR